MTLMVASLMLASIHCAPFPDNDAKRAAAEELATARQDFLTSITNTLTGNNGDGPFGGLASFINPSLSLPSLSTVRAMFQSFINFIPNLIF